MERPVVRRVLPSYRYTAAMSDVLPGPTRRSVMESTTIAEPLLARLNFRKFTPMAPFGSVAPAGLSEARETEAVPETPPVDRPLSWLIVWDELISAVLL